VTTSKGATRRLRSLTGRTASPFPAYRITHAASAQRPWRRRCSRSRRFHC